MPWVSIALPSPPILTWVAVSGTCLTSTRIFIDVASRCVRRVTVESRSWGRGSRRRNRSGVGRCVAPAAVIVAKLTCDAEAVAGDEHAVVDDRSAVGGGGHAVGAEGRDAGPAAELPRRAPRQGDRGDGLARGGDLDAELVDERL